MLIAEDWKDIFRSNFLEMFHQNLKNWNIKSLKNHKILSSSWKSAGAPHISSKILIWSSLGSTHDHFYYFKVGAVDATYWRKYELIIHFFWEMVLVFFLLGHDVNVVAEVGNKLLDLATFLFWLFLPFCGIYELKLYFRWYSTVIQIWKVLDEINLLLLPFLPIFWLNYLKRLPFDMYYSVPLKLDIGQPAIMVLRGKWSNHLIHRIHWM